MGVKESIYLHFILIMSSGHVITINKRISKMAAAEGIQLLTLEFLTFDSKVLETNVIPHCRLIWVHRLRWNGYFYVSSSSRGQN